MWMNKKFVYQVGNNKKVILWCTANQISSIQIVAPEPLQPNKPTWLMSTK